jgi:hypothetical protein
MPNPATPLTWTRHAQNGREVYLAERGPFEFEIRAIRSKGYRLRAWYTRPEDRPMPVQPTTSDDFLTFCESHAESLGQAQDRAAQLVWPAALLPDLNLRIHVNRQDIERARSLASGPEGVGPLLPLLPAAPLWFAVQRAVTERLGDGWMARVDAEGSGRVSVYPQNGRGSARWMGTLPAEVNAWARDDRYRVRPPGGVRREHNAIFDAMPEIAFDLELKEGRPGPWRIRFDPGRGKPLPPNTKWVGPGSRFDNPYRRGTPGVRTQAAAVRRYAADLAAGRLVTRVQGQEYRITLQGVRRELAGYHLACACRLTQACHAAVLLHHANAA